VAGRKRQSASIAAAGTALVAPALFILLRLYVFVPIALGKVPLGFGFCVRSLHRVARWSMVEVFMMGTLVAVVRSAGLASATPGIGLFAYAALTLLLTSILAAGTHSLWKIGSELGSTR
jgi:paraquat-inducible protein A